MHKPLRLRLHRDALASNWQKLADLSGTATGAAVKADGYGLGAAEVVSTLYQAGARDYFVATWDEAAALVDLPDDTTLAVLHGLGPDDAPSARSSPARPVLNSIQQVKRWRVGFPQRACDVMVDTGMNRLGLSLDELGALDGLTIDTLHSHLACADEPGHAMNARQLARFREAKEAVPAKRYSLANSAGILLGRDYAFDLVRPGLALYGAAPTPGAGKQFERVVHAEAQILQLKTLKAGDSIGYGATFTADRDTPVAILNFGYADGYPRNLSGLGHARQGDTVLPLLGRVSMDLIAADVSRARDLKEGDWLEVDFDPAEVARQAGISPYEALTGLGQRFDRRWV